ncbi:MAG TPA: nuclear transport factor 2 family protein [Acidimicrobiales bacterium]|jgi:predicted SnoaL-like aldol condensation-catalyzing enzyme|nr:nuclear transport factor 2 family protein [Acidimicrobiales bacterium]
MTTRRDIATTFEQLVVSGQVRAAYDRYVSPDYIHHNPWFDGDRESLLVGLENSAAEFADKEYEVQRVLEDGDLVAIHSRLRPMAQMPEMAIVHIYRFEGEQIVEEWDLAQPLPDDSPNGHGLF